MSSPQRPAATLCRRPGDHGYFHRGLAGSNRWPAFPGQHRWIPAYISAITTTLPDRCDFAKLIKVYVSDPEGQRRYSPPDVTHVERVSVIGKPDATKICTSQVERQNSTTRMQMRRLTRLANTFSRKRENLWAAYCLHFGYNFCRIHQRLRITPAIAAGITDHVWDLGELLNAK